MICDKELASLRNERLNIMNRLKSGSRKPLEDRKRLQQIDGLIPKLERKQLDAHYQDDAWFDDEKWVPICPSCRNDKRDCSCC